MGYCGSEQLHAAAVNGESSLIIVDVEGAESDLLDPGNIPGLANAYMIVEIHDFIDQQLCETVSSRLRSSHSIEEARTQRRSSRDFREPSGPWLRLRSLP